MLGDLERALGSDLGASSEEDYEYPLEDPELKERGGQERGGRSDGSDMAGFFGRAMPAADEARVLPSTESNSSPPPSSAGGVTDAAGIAAIITAAVLISIALGCLALRRWHASGNSLGLRKGGSTRSRTASEMAPPLSGP